jgi:adenosine deaminase
MAQLHVPRQPMGRPVNRVEKHVTDVDSTPKSSPWRALPKVLLHEHLDGGLRPQTLLELCRAQGLRLPSDDAEDLARWIQANAHSGSLERYLQGFALTVAAMASADACDRVAFEAAEDAWLDGCVLAEFRIAPLLLEPFGLAGEAAVEAMLNGLHRSAPPRRAGPRSAEGPRPGGIASGLIVCAMRTDSPEQTERSARLAARFAGRGVIGFDLAGAERGFPPGAHARAFAIARDAGLGLTCHAGEADDGSRVLEAAALGATRIGHGVNIMQGARTDQPPRWIDEARRLGLHFEVCPTSNVHTGAADSLAAHPMAAMVQAGLSVSCSTDNRLMSGVTLSGELAALHEHNGLSLELAQVMMRAAADASFMPQPARQAAHQALDGWRGDVVLGG